MKISDRLEKAIDYLKKPGETFLSERETFSCNAIKKTFEFYPEELPAQIHEGLENMGLNTESPSQYDDMEWEDRQQARAIWLTWAAMMAREQGL